MGRLVRPRHSAAVRRPVHWGARRVRLPYSAADRFAVRESGVHLAPTTRDREYLAFHRANVQSARARLDLQSAGATGRSTCRRVRRCVRFHAVADYIQTDRARQRAGWTLPAHDEWPYVTQVASGNRLLETTGVSNLEKVGVAVAVRARCIGLRRQL